MTCESCLKKNRCDFRKKLLALIKDHNGQFRNQQEFLHSIESVLAEYCEEYFPYYTLEYVAYLQKEK